MLKSLNIYKNVFKSELKIKIKQTSHNTVLLSVLKLIKQKAMC